MSVLQTANKYGTVPYLILKRFAAKFTRDCAPMLLPIMCPQPQNVLKNFMTNGALLLLIWIGGLVELFHVD
jgi:hypothetical protein